MFTSKRTSPFDSRGSGDSARVAHRRRCIALHPSDFVGSRRGLTPSWTDSADSARAADVTPSGIHSQTSHTTSHAKAVAAESKTRYRFASSTRSGQ